MSMKIAIAGGGTGGHLMPALAVAEVLQERGDEVIIFISEKGVDALATKDRSEFRYQKLPGIGMPKLLSPAIFSFVKRFNQSLAPCRDLYKKFQPDAVLGMGGFTSTAPILAGKLRKIPTFLHESNAIPGKANRLNARMVDTVFLGFGECAKYFPNANCEVTGTPIRKTLAQRVPREQALAAFGLQPDRKTLLVMGGSQGAHGINEAVIKALSQLNQLPIQVIHLAGTQDENLVVANYRREGVPAYVAGFCHQMENAYSAADFSITRSGAASVSELSHFGIPSLLIPFPQAADNHQALNAEIFEKAGAATVLKQADITAETMADKVRWFLADPERLGKMSEACLRLAPQEAARRLVEAMQKKLT